METVIIAFLAGALISAVSLIVWAVWTMNK